MSGVCFSLPVLVLLLGFLPGPFAWQKGVEPVANPSESRIVLFHLNDVHGKIDAFAKAAAIIEQERQGGAEVFVVCAGDSFTGNPVIDQYDPPGEPMWELLNRLGVDLLSPGNHEFDYGLDNLGRFASRARFPLVSANTMAPPGVLPQLRSSVVLTTHSGVKVAVFGLIQIEAGSGLPSTHPDRVKGLRFADPLARALELKPLRAECDVLIALTHLGYEQDLLLAERMPELDVIIGGHSHTRVDPAESVHGVLIAQAGSDSRFLGRVELRVRDRRLVEKRGSLIDLKEPHPEVAAVREMITRFNQNPAFSRVIVQAPHEISGKDALGSLMTDALCRVHGLDIAFQNDGGIRLNHLPEKITLKDIYTLDPFGNQVVQIAMNAAEIRSLIASSFAGRNEVDLQVAGISYVIRCDRDGRLIDIQLRAGDGSPLPEDKEFQVGMSSYVASSYPFVHRDPGRSLQSTTAAALIRYLAGGIDLGQYRNVRRAFLEKRAGDGA